MKCTVQRKSLRVFVFETSVCRVLMLKTHSHRVANAVVANAQSQGGNVPAKAAKEEENLPTDKIIVSAWCRAPYRRIINYRLCELTLSFGTSGLGPVSISETLKKTMMYLRKDCN